MEKVAVDIILFMYIFMPPLKINILHILFLGGILYLVINIKKISKIKKKNIYYENIFFISLIILYSSLLVLISENGDIKILKAIIISFVEMYTISLTFCFYLKINKKSFIYLWDRLYKIAILQSIIALISFTFKEVQLFILNNFLKIKLSNEQIKILESIASRRLYGLSNGLTYSTPIYQAILSSSFLFYKKSNKIICLIIFISAIINARIAIIVFIIVLVLSLIQKIKNNSIVENFKFFLKGLMLIIIFLIVSNIIMNNLFINNNTLLWIKEAFDEIFNLFKGEKKGTFYYLFEKFLIFPKGFQLIFGEGYTLFGKEAGSDIGYINDLWFGGIIYTVLIWIFFIRNFISLYKNTEIRKLIYLKMFLNILLVTTIISHIKGTNYTFSSFWGLILIVFSYNTLKEKKNKDRENNNERK